MPSEKEASELESLFSTDTHAAAVVEGAVTSDGLGNLNLPEQMSAFSGDGHSVDQVCCFVTRLASLKRDAVGENACLLFHTQMRDV